MFPSPGLDRRSALQCWRSATRERSAGVHCPLRPGEASFHHGWTVHRSAPNTSADRRIGLNVQYVAPDNSQHGAATTATLVRGEDRFGSGWRGWSRWFRDDDDRGLRWV